MHSNSFQRLSLIPAAVAALWIAEAAFVQAQRPTVTLTEPEYRELRMLSSRLDAKARHAADQAAHDQYRIYRRDNGFVRAVSDFARRASRFNTRMADYRARPWPVDDDLRSLLRGAGDVQDRARTSRFADAHTLGDWNEIVDILNRMVNQTQPGGGHINPPPADYARDEYGERHDPPGRGDSRDLAGLVRELEDRAARARELAKRVAAERGPYRREFLVSIGDFHDQAVAFRRRVESGPGDRREIRAEAARLLESARETDQRMRQGNGFREVWPEWQGVMQVLQRILDRTGNR